MVRITFGKIMILFLMLGFGVFLGMDVATRGLDQIKGQAVRTDSTVRSEVESIPTMGTTSQKVAQQTQVTKSTTGQSVQSTQAVKTTKATEQPAAVSRPQQAATLQVSFINRLSNRTGDAIRRLAYGSMQGVTSFFQRVIE